jgi:hypothetical protein
LFEETGYYLNHWEKRCVCGFTVRACGDARFWLVKSILVGFFVDIKYFPIEQIRFTQAELKKGDRVGFQCDEDKLWAIGWHDHHYECHVITHETNTLPAPGKPAGRLKKNRQDTANHEH